jgi:hypothetical protein
MNKNDDDYYDRQTELLEKFLSKNDKSAFQKILNMNITSNAERENKKEKFRNRSNLLKSMKTKPSSYYYEHFHMNNPQSNYNISPNNSDLYNFNYNNNFKDNQISSFKLDFNNILQDPEYKDKCWRGNNKWGSMKFQMIKLNLAKRKGVSIDNFQMPKLPERRSSQMEMNGHLVINSNPLINSVELKRKNTSNNNTIGHTYKNKISRLNSQDIAIKRQLTQKIKPHINTEVKELKIEI